MIVWREKFIATGVHFLLTLTLAACAAALVFLVWYPDPFQTMIGGTELFLLVVGCDLALGPLISLVIYNSRKSRRELITDYAIVGAVQVAAMVYGVSILAGTRPVYVSFTFDRLEVVSASDITDAELAAARKPEYAKVSYTGPSLVATFVPDADRNDAMMEGVKGNDVYLRPKFYVPYETQLAQILAHAKPLSELTARKPEAKPLFDAAMRDIKLPPDRIRWLPVHHIKGFWTALIDVNDGKPVRYVNFDTY